MEYKIQIYFIYNINVYDVTICNSRTHASSNSRHLKQKKPDGRDRKSRMKSQILYPDLILCPTI